MRSWNTTMKCTLVCTLALSVMITSNVNAQPKKPQPAAKAAEPTPVAPSAPAKLKEDKVDVSDLENKYWAPKDTDFSVVQNRTYTKEKRFSATLHYGPIVNDKYSEGYIPGVSLNYFTSERIGFQATYLHASLEDSEVVSNLHNSFATSIQPNFGRVTDYYGLGMSWVPFYAKMSFMGRKIMYFDMAITPMVGMTKYEQQVITGNHTKNALTYGFDVTQYFFLKNWFAIRADLKNQWFSEERLKYYDSTAGNIGKKVNDQLNHTTLFLLGVTFFY
jgi:outer membrane beta-barrel protein